MSAAYLLCLIASLGCMVLLDARLGLFFWRDARRAAVVLTAGVLFFLAWDLAGIGLGVFFRGQTDYMLDVNLAPELPLEEVFFLTFLCYLVMNLFFLFQRLIEGRQRRPSTTTGTGEHRGSP